MIADIGIRYYSDKDYERMRRYPDGGEEYKPEPFTGISSNTDFDYK